MDNIEHIKNHLNAWFQDARKLYRQNAVHQEFLDDDKDDLAKCLKTIEDFKDRDYWKERCEQIECFVEGMKQGLPESMLDKYVTKWMELKSKQP